MASILGAIAPRHKHCGLDLLAACSPCGLWMKLTLRACYDLAGIWCDIHTGDSLVMPNQLILKLEGTARFGIQFDIVVSSYCERLTVGGEGVVRDGMVKELLDFGGRHYFE